MNENTQKHPFAPVFDEHSKVLILGSFPPLHTSQKGGFYYADSTNRFWGILDRLFDEPNLPKHSKDEKIAFLKAHKIALYDIWGVCYKDDPNSPDDDSIVAQKSQKADLSEILKVAKIEKIFTTIGKSFEKWGIESWLWGEYAKYFPHCKNASQMVISLCSTSGATRLSYGELIEKHGYKQIAEILRKG